MKKKICIVVANYYQSISKDLLNGTTKVLNNIGIKNFKKIIVPGVFEIPFVISKKINNYDAFIALGCIIKGETPHFNLISKASINAIMEKINPTKSKVQLCMPLISNIDAGGLLKNPSYSKIFSPKDVS